MTAASIVERKLALRRESRHARDAISLEARERMSAELCTRLLAMIDPRATVMSYVAIRSEVDLRDFAASHAGEVVYPRVEDSLLVAVPADTDMVRSAFGVPEPVGAPIDPQRIDVVLVPGLAFDRGGGRLGYGAGFYDRFLPELRATTVMIGVGFAIQLVASVPVDEHDRLLDVVVTDSEVIRAAATGDRR